MYAIWNKKTLKWWYGSDYRWHPPHQRTSDEKAVTFPSREEAEDVMIARRINPKKYEIVKVKLYEVEECQNT